MASRIKLVAGEDLGFYTSVRFTLELLEDLDPAEEAAGDSIPALAIILAMYELAEAFDEERAAVPAGEEPNPIFAIIRSAFMFDIRPELARNGAGAATAAEAPW